jgi:hypothetical protein
VPAGGITYGALRRQQKASEVLGDIPVKGQKYFRDWRRLTHDGYRLSARCMRCGDVFTPAELVKLEALYGTYRLNNHA